MIEKVNKSIEEARAGVTGRLSKIVMEYVSIYDRIAARAKQPDFSKDEWDELAALLNVEKFERVGAQQEVMDWPAYRARLSEFAGTAHWNGTFRRISELPQLVLLELIEEMSRGDEVETVNSVTVYEFDEHDKITHFDCYLQKPVGGSIAVYRAKETTA